VIYRRGEREYPDAVDVSSGWQREQSLRRALEAFALPADNPPSLDGNLGQVSQRRGAMSDFGVFEGFGSGSFVDRLTIVPFEGVCIPLNEASPPSY
jgi:hypothetical protein